MNGKKRTESAVLHAFLRRLGVNPASIEARERPDFVITIEDQTVGVEITSSIPEEYARAAKLHASRYPSRWLNTTHLRRRSRRRSNAELVRSMESSALLQPWKPVHAVMQDWQQDISSALAVKRQKLLQRGYKTFDHNWLVIHDERPLLTTPLCQFLAPRHLHNAFQSMAPSRDFDSVFVFSPHYMFRWESGELLKLYDIGETK